MLIHFTGRPIYYVTFYAIKVIYSDSSDFIQKCVKLL